MLEFLRDPNAPLPEDFVPSVLQARVQQKDGHDVFIAPTIFHDDAIDLEPPAYCPFMVVPRYFSGYWSFIIAAKVLEQKWNVVLAHAIPCN